MEKRNKEKLDLLEKKVKLLRDGEGKLRKICEHLKTDICEDVDRVFCEMEDSYVKAFLEELKDGKTTEKKALQTLSDQFSNETKQLVDRIIPKINDKFKEWDEGVEEVTFFKESRAESKTFAVECKGLPPDNYNCYKDPDFYLRNRFVSAILLASVFATVGKLASKCYYKDHLPRKKS